MYFHPQLYGDLNCMYVYTEHVLLNRQINDLLPVPCCPVSPGISWPTSFTLTLSWCFPPGSAKTGQVLHSPPVAPPGSVWERAAGQALDTCAYITNPLRPFVRSDPGLLSCFQTASNTNCAGNVSGHTLCSCVCSSGALMTAYTAII